MMEHISRRRALGWIAAAGLSGLAGGAAARSMLPPLEAALNKCANLLREIVTPAGLVDYKRLTADRTRLDIFIKLLGDTNPADWSYTPQTLMMFYINAYNAITLQRIIDHYPPTGPGTIHPKLSIRNIPGVWDKIKTRVFQEEMTLDHLEHGILRKKYDDPRIHFAIVCAALSCPRLRNVSYGNGNELEAQLDEAATEFARDPAKNLIEPDKRLVTISAILDWYKDDFAKYREEVPKLAGGRHDKRAGSIGYLARYGDPALKGFIASGDYEIKVGKYDWTLNSIEGA